MVSEYKVQETTNAWGKNWVGVSTYTKPTATIPNEDGFYAATNDLLLEEDTGKFYFYAEDDDWYEVGYNA